MLSSDALIRGGLKIGKRNPEGIKNSLGEETFPSIIKIKSVKRPAVWLKKI